MTSSLRAVVVTLLSLHRWCRVSSFGVTPPLRKWPSVPNYKILYKAKDKQEDEQDSAEWLNAELVDDGEFFAEDEDDDWIPDREMAKRKSQQRQNAAAATFTKVPTKDIAPESENEKEEQKPKEHVYTPEEEELITAMGGKFKDGPTKRQPGYLGDCTLQEIATDYSVPVCYLADVLTMWGVPVPINVQDRLGDLITGEQAFAILEAINSLDVASLHDRYSDMNLVAVCDWNDIDLKEAFEMAIKEGWSLPFGVQTCLRVEQEEELVRTLASPV